MASSSNNKNHHLTHSDRIIIETGITNGSSKAAIAENLGKDKSTIGKEIKLHRYLSKRCHLPIECSNYKKCKYNRECSKNCSDFVLFSCKRRDRSPGACNGCSNSKKCHFNQYRYSADLANKDYRNTLVDSRSGINSSKEQIQKIGNIIQPLINKGQSIYSIKKNHDKEIPVSDRTIYNYIAQGVFQAEGISIKKIDLPASISRKIRKKDALRYKQRKDYSYLKGRTKSDFDTYMIDHPNAHIVEMDTVYNDITIGPFLQTFKLLKYDLLLIVYHTRKTADEMHNGILYLERILGHDVMNKEFEVLKTDRGTEFINPERIEVRDDGSLRTRVFYCDPMASWQKGSLENIHELIRRILPKTVNLYDLGFDSQDKAILVSSHINSYAKEKLDGKSAFQLAQFYNCDLFDRLMAAGFSVISPDDIILKPYLVK